MGKACECILLKKQENGVCPEVGAPSYPAYPPTSDATG